MTTSLAEEGAKDIVKHIFSKIDSSKKEMTGMATMTYRTLDRVSVGVCPQ